MWIISLIAGRIMGGYSNLFIIIKEAAERLLASLKVLCLPRVKTMRRNWLKS